MHEVHTCVFFMDICAGKEDGKYEKKYGATI